MATKPCNVNVVVPPMTERSPDPVSVLMAKGCEFVGV